MCLLFSHKSQKNITPVEGELKVLPSTRLSSVEVYSKDNENLVLKKREKIEWLAGGLLENLLYRLYDEAAREVLLTAGIAAKIKVVCIIKPIPVLSCLIMQMQVS